MKRVVAETHEREPYEGLAAIYDYVMRHVDYEGWAAYVRRPSRPTPCSHASWTAGSVEVACGPSPSTRA